MATVAAGVLAGPAAHAQPAADPRTVILTPSIGVQGMVTDNVNLTSTDRETDFITRVFAGLQGSVSGARTKAILDVQAAYDLYANTDDLNGWSANGFAAGSYALVQNFLWLEADAGVTTGNISTFGTPAIDRAGVADRIVLSNIAIGPRLTTTLGSYADLDAQARVSRQTYDAADGSTVTDTPDDATLAEVTAVADTGRRFANYQFLLSGGYQQDDEDFRRYETLASAFVRVAPSVRLIGRIGYEDIQEDSVVDLQAARWSVGVEYSPNERARFSVEGGQRFEETSWAADAFVQVSDRFYLTGSYSESVEPDQVFIDNAFAGFIGEVNAPPTPLTPDRFTINGNLYSETSLNKVADVHAIYQWPAQQLEFSATWSDRQFLESDTEDRTLITGLDYTRNIRPDLTGRVGLNYAETFESQVYGESRSYGVTGQLDYSINPTLLLTGGYSYIKDELLTGDREEIYENVVFVGLQKTF